MLHMVGVMLLCGGVEGLCFQAGGGDFCVVVTVGMEICQRMLWDSIRRELDLSGSWVEGSPLYSMEGDCSS